jgi:hypothetical protein
MTTSTAAAQDRTRQLTADIDQLVNPIHTAVRSRIITHTPLLDQLRDAATPGRTSPPIRRPAPASRPPARLDALDTLAEVYVGISAWHARLHLASPPHGRDWQKHVLRQLADQAANLDPAIADWLAVEVHQWWADAATAAGWRPADLIRLR